MTRTFCFVVILHAQRVFTLSFEIKLFTDLKRRLFQREKRKSRKLQFAYCILMFSCRVANRSGKLEKSGIPGTPGIFRESRVVGVRENVEFQGIWNWSGKMWNFREFGIGQEK